MTARLLILFLMFAFTGAARNAQTQGCTDEQSSVPADTLITLAERGCLVKITADGTIAVEGNAFDIDITRLRTKISAAELKKLICEFNRINYFSLNDRYCDQADGCPELGYREIDNIILTSITLNGRSRSVTHCYYLCCNRDGSSYPRELTALEKHIRDVVGMETR